MGLLSSGSPLEWNEAKKYADHVRMNGIEQLISAYNRVRERKYDFLKWGDEVEYVLVEIDPENRQCRISLRAEEVLAMLKAEMKEKHEMMEPCRDRNMKSSPIFTATWHPEYGRYMLEGTPAFPYRHDVKDLLCVEQNMILRRKQAETLLRPNEKLVAMGNFPRLGCPDAFDGSILKLTNDASRSLFFPDEFINTHARFKTLTKNIRERRRRKVCINLPIYQDKDTTKLALDRQSALFPEVLDETPDYRDDAIHLDAMGFGMGCCCLQITFQTREVSEARRLYDQLAVVCPVMLALTAATPVYRGILSDVDCRWNIISALVDDRTDEERSCIPKSRYSSISCYISQDPRMRAQFNDVQLPYNKCCYSRLIDAGFDELLARHFAWLFIRDPLVIYEELLNQDNETSSDHFENIQSTNWQTMRFKPPPSENPTIGWRVEFRPMEVQFADFENAACAVFVVLLTRIILSYDLNFYIPISLVDENMETAQCRDALLNGKFHWRSGMRDGDSEVVRKLTIAEIINGCPQGQYVGLVPMIEKYLDTLDIDYDTRHQLNEYLNFIRLRAAGKLMTPARWIRNFVMNHPDYNNDSFVSLHMNFDLIGEIDHVTHHSMNYSSTKLCCDYAEIK